MNKKQLIVAWMVAVVFGYVAFSHPMDEFIRVGSAVLLLGGLFVYTLRTKKS